MGKRPEDCPELPMPLHTVIQLTPLPYGCEVRFRVHTRLSPCCAVRHYCTHASSSQHTPTLPHTPEQEVWHSPMSGVPGEEPEHQGVHSHHAQVHPRNQGGDI